ncbi:MAG: NrsF family protein [Pseudomonadota bacterium]
MKTDDLISALAQENGAALRAPGLTLSLTMGACLAVAGTIGLSVLLYGVRSDGPTSGALGLGVWSLLAVVALISATRLKLPEPAPWLVIVGPLVGLLSLLLVVAMLAHSQGIALVRMDHLVHCLQTVGLLSVIPFLGMSAMMRRNAPASPLAAGAIAGLVAGAVGALAYSISCPISDPVASLSAHTLTVLIIASVGALLGHRFYAW